MSIKNLVFSAFLKKIKKYGFQGAKEPFDDHLSESFFTRES